MADVSTLAHPRIDLIFTFPLGSNGSVMDRDKSEMGGEGRGRAFTVEKGWERQCNILQVI
jgi:hypothetical protein